MFFSHDNAMSRAEDLRVAINARKRPTLTDQQRQAKAVIVLEVGQTLIIWWVLSRRTYLCWRGHATAFLS